MIKKILIVHGINYWNIGDLGITDAMISTFKEGFQDAKIKFVTPYYNWEKPKNSFLEQKNKLLPDIFLFPSQKESKSKKNKFKYFLKSFFNLFQISIFAILYKLFKFKPYFILEHFQKETIREYFNSDIIISKGGGFLYDHGRFLISPHLIPIIFSIWIKKPIVIYSQSIGPFNRKLSKILYKFILKKVNLIIVREKISKKILEEMGIDSILGYDAAFDLRKSKDTESLKKINKLIFEKKKGNTILIGMSILDWKFPNFSGLDAKLKKEKYYSSLAKSINYLNKKYKCFFFFYPHSIEGLESDDVYAINKVILKTNLSDNYLLFKYKYNPRIFLHMLEKMDFCIGSRMHSNIFTLISNTPLVAISYLPKTKGIMGLLGLKEYVLNIDEIDEKKLINKIKLVLENKKILKIKIRKEIQNAKENSKKNIGIIKNYFDTINS